MPRKKKTETAEPQLSLFEAEPGLAADPSIPVVTESAQLSLFGGGAPPEASPPKPEPAALEDQSDLRHLTELASRMPPGLRMGTSSWTFEGWKGIVYHRTYNKTSFQRDSLEEYAQHPLLTTVGIDSTYYTPPREDLLARYATQLPIGYLCASKVWEQLTMPAFPEHKRYGQNAGRNNPHFLDPEVFEDLILPPYANVFRNHTGPFLFEFAPMKPDIRPAPDQFCEKLDAFLGRLPKGWPYAVEIRNRELLTQDYLEVLRRHETAHVLNQWSFMPSVGQQAQIDGILTAAHVVIRLLMRPGTRYEARLEAMAPFDKIMDPDPKLRRDVAQLALQATGEGREVYVLVNNKAEGSAPLTVQAVAEEIASVLDEVPF